MGNVAEKYWDKVDKARQYFSEELESLFPNIDLSKKTLTINEEDLDLFVLHTYAHVLFYQKELAKMETIMQEKLFNAVEAARRGGGEFLTNAQVCEALEQEKRKLNLCFQQQVRNVNDNNNNLYSLSIKIIVQNTYTGRRIENFSHLKIFIQKLPYRICIVWGFSILLKNYT